MVKVMTQEKMDTNPWINIWFHPAKTIRSIINYNPSYGFFGLASILGFVILLNYAQTFSLGQAIPVGVLILVSLVLSAPIGWLAIAIQSWFLTFIGRWFGGVAPYSHVKSAVAWANLPNIINIVGWFVLIAYYGSDIFNNDFSTSSLIENSQGVLISILLLQFVQSIWSLVIQIICLAEVHQYSAWRSIFTVIVATLLTIAVWALAFALVGIFFGGAEQSLQ